MILPVETPRPRDRTDQEFNALRREILQHLKKQKANQKESINYQTGK
jgi:ABC-type nitrate/sulfonate/bicarbonate transport system ATPase subunit